MNRIPCRIHYASLHPSALRIADWAGGGQGHGLAHSTLKPGEGAKLAASGQELRGWDEYAMLVARAYKAAPNETAQGVQAYVALKQHILKMFQRMKSKIKVEFVHDDPYQSAQQMMQEVQSTGVLQISDDFNQSAAFGPEVNLMLRAVHDFEAHLMSTPGKRKPSSFTLEGEMQAYNRHLHLVGCQAHAAGALFTEIVGQVCVFIHFGSFPDQKIITMPGFDWCKIGAVKGMSLKDGDLV